MTTFFSKSILAAAALCAVGTSVLTTATPASAAKNMCRYKYDRCQQRCARAGDFIACINRTCNRQYDNCLASGTNGTRK